MLLSAGVSNYGRQFNWEEVSKYLCKEVWSLDCDVVDAVKVLLGGMFQVAHGHDACIGDEDIDLAEFGDGGVNEAVEVWKLGSVGLNSESSILADFLDEFVGGGGVGVVVEHDAGAFAGETLGGGFADAFGGTGDEDDFSRERHCD